jgi:hypothetical protein
MASLRRHSAIRVIDDAASAVYDRLRLLLELKRTLSPRHLEIAPCLLRTSATPATKPSDVASKTSLVTDRNRCERLLE